MTRRAYAGMKRVGDVVVAAICLLVTLPVFFVIALLVLIFHGRPVMFVQKRVTQKERIFMLRKFRSMRIADPGRGLVSDDDRLTAFGRALRASSLDELPSLWNVLAGDMSLIGPRPLLTDQLSYYTPVQRRRHEVRAGITGLAQASGRNRLTWDERFDLDVEYVDSMSPVLDAKILGRTVLTVLRREGISPGGAGDVTPDYGGTLRSEIVKFDALDGSCIFPWRWRITTADGEEIGVGGLRLVGPREACIDLALTSSAVDEDLIREALQLILNRAWGWGRKRTFCRKADNETVARILDGLGIDQLDPEHTSISQETS